jgi:linoleoyl-CoA desaturase
VSAVWKEAWLPGQTLRFPVRGEFHARVQQYFADHGVPPTGAGRRFLKTGLMLPWGGLSYRLSVWWATSLLTTLLTVLALAQGFMRIGLNLMHDGAHHRYSRHQTVHGLMTCTFDGLGGSQVLGRQKHNFLHHTLTKMHGFDADLSTAGLFRLRPEQP